MNPRVVASWDAMPDLHQPRRGEDGSFGVDALAAHLSDPAVAAGVAQSEPAPGPNGKVPRGIVWHCSLRNSAEDVVLDDGQWAEVATELMDRTGIARAGDPAACRWIAVRHADDHVHVAAMLVRPDNGRRVHPRRDYVVARQVCREAEDRLGLIPTGAVDRTAVSAPTQAELKKAERGGRGQTSREQLRGQVREAAVSAHDVEGFFVELENRGAWVCARRGADGTVLGYAAPGYLTADGGPVWFSGGTLAPDLSLPKLVARWAAAPDPAAPIPPTSRERSRVGRAERAAATQDALSAMDHATAVLAAGEDCAGLLDAVAHATGDMVTVVGRVASGGWRIGVDGARFQDEVCRPYDRAAHTPQQVQPDRWPAAAAQLRTAAWRLSGTRVILRAGDGAALVVALAALVAEVAALLEARGRIVQSRAARQGQCGLDGALAVLQAQEEATAARPAPTAPSRPRTQGPVQPGRPRPSSPHPDRSPRRPDGPRRSR